jgi:hypothetical protein
MIEFISRWLKHVAAEDKLLITDDNERHSLTFSLPQLVNFVIHPMDSELCWHLATAWNGFFFFVSNSQNG